MLVNRTTSRSNAAIHMFFVRMDLAVIWLDEDGQVVDLVLAKSWGPIHTPAEPARYILEVHPDRLPEFMIGDRISFE